MSVLLEIAFDLDCWSLIFCFNSHRLAVWFECDCQNSKSCEIDVFISFKFINELNAVAKTEFVLDNDQNQLVFYQSLY